MDFTSRLNKILFETSYSATSEYLDTPDDSDIVLMKKVLASQELYHDGIVGGLNRDRKYATVDDLKGALMEYNELGANVHEVMFIKHMREHKGVTLEFAKRLYKIINEYYKLLDQATL